MTRRLVYALQSVGLLLSVIFAPADCLASKSDKEDKYVVAYVTSWSDEIPDPNYMTHINYAFGHVTDSRDSVRVDNLARFRAIAGLKRAHPGLRVMLSIGGWGSGGFSEMAADAGRRKKFAEACRDIVETYGIDGIDIDWEYPGSSAGGIASSPDDPRNFVSLLHQLRSTLGKDRLLTIASAADGAGCRFKDFIDDVDFINVMTYDMAALPRHHSPLHKSERTGDMVVETAVARHLEAGVPPEKLLLGVPFYGRGLAPYDSFVNYSNVTVLPGCEERWDDEAQVPYIADKDGNLLLGYDNARSMTLKCDYARQLGLKGIMYWDYSGDRANGELRTVVAGRMLGNR